MIPDDFMDRDVWASENDQERYWLARWTTGRPINPHLLAIFLMLNPSKARGEGVGDPTQRKCNGFADRMGARRYGLINLFAYSTPYPEELFEFGYDAAVGKHNDEVTQRVMFECKRRHLPLICAWGKPSKLRRSELELMDMRVRHVVQFAKAVEIPLYCLAKTPDGAPRHPLMLGYEDGAKLLPWGIPK